MSSAEELPVVVVAVLLVAESMVVDEDVVVALAKMDAGSGMMCESEGVGNVVEGMEGRAGLEGVESEERHSVLSLSPGVDNGAAMPIVEADGVPMACGVYACVGGDDADTTV